MADITTAKILDYVTKRQADSWVVRQSRTVEHEDGTVTEVPEVRRGVSNGEINRELGVLKRAFGLATQSQRIFFASHIPMLKEANPRTDFFTPDDFEALRAQLPAHLQGRNPCVGSPGSNSLLRRRIYARPMRRYQSRANSSPMVSGSGGGG